MAHPERLATIKADGQHIIDATRATPERIVPQYPTWTLHDLLLHVATIHARTAEICTSLPQERVPFPALSPGDDLCAQAENELGRLLEALAAADPDAEVWTFGSDHHVRFWERRMVLETGVHRWDAQGAVGTPDPLRPRVAIDGLDEFSDFYLGRLGDVPTIDVHATDVDRTWRYGDGAPTATVEGTASSLFLRLMSRPGTPFPAAWETVVDALATPAD
jgi:uncharacterized protein (TIGR03083 family)